MISIPFYIWGMLTTAPLKGAYLHQLLQLCQALHPQAPFVPPSPTPQLYPQAQCDPSHLLQQQLQHMQHSQQHAQRQGQQPNSPYAQQMLQQLSQRPSQQHSQQHSQLHAQLQAQLQQQLLAMSQANPNAAAAAAASSSAMPWLGDPAQATQIIPPASDKLSTDPLVANARLHQQVSKQLQANAAEHLRAAVSQAAAYDSSDNHSPVSDSSGQHPVALPAGHFSPISSHYSQENQIAPPLVATTVSGSQQAVPSMMQAVADAQALTQQAQQKLAAGAVQGDSPVGPTPSFWAGAEGQKAMAEGQGSFKQGTLHPSTLSTSQQQAQQDSTQQGLTQQGTAQQARASSEQPLPSKAMGLPQQLPFSGLSQQALYQQALYQQGLSGTHLLPGHGTSFQGSPNEARAKGSPGPQRAQAPAQLQQGSPQAAAIQSLVMQLQSAGTALQAVP